MKPGTFLKSITSPDSDFFDGAIVFIATHGETGTTGFVINRMFHRRFNELAEFNQYNPFPMYEGGPVQVEQLFMLHCRPDLITGGRFLANGIYLGGNFKDAIDLLNTDIITNKDLKLFVGYCGWDKGELEQELEDGGWTVISQADAFVL